MSLLPNQTRRQTPRSQNQPPKNRRRWSIDLAMQIDCVDNTLLQQIFGTPVFTYTSFISNFNLYASLMKFHIIRFMHKSVSVCALRLWTVSMRVLHSWTASVGTLHSWTVSLCTLHLWSFSLYTSWSFSLYTSFMNSFHSLFIILWQAIYAV